MSLSPTETVRAILRQRFAPPEWVLMEELAPKTGGGTGYADAVAMNLWKSRGYAVGGMEIKVHRGDWLRELKKPAKAEDVFRYCNTWTVVALPGVVEPGEVPVTWGLTEVQSGRLVEVVKAPALTPDPLDRPFVASLMRRGFAQIDKLAELRQRQTIADMQAQIEARITSEVERRTHRYEDLKKAVEKWEAATGLTFGRYGGRPERSSRWRNTWSASDSSLRTTVPIPDSRSWGPWRTTCRRRRRWCVKPYRRRALMRPWPPENLKMAMFHGGTDEQHKMVCL